MTFSSGVCNVSLLIDIVLLPSITVRLVIVFLGFFCQNYKKKLKGKITYMTHLYDCYQFCYPVVHRSREFVCRVNNELKYREIEKGGSKSQRLNIKIDTK